MHELIQSASSMLHYIQIVIHIILLFYRSKHSSFFNF
uniref:Uncharacterized protein n=1 Tax=Siphoviridae sp. ctqPo10 TaxID=2827948 RepID=A0A8S5SUS9_9CAUD|nr:MAG TPA: hypothetical protein [Siphoviridae sp. ctqPo10]